MMNALNNKTMIIITRSYEIKERDGGYLIPRTDRAVFNDSDTDSVREFLNEAYTKYGEKMYNIDFEYTKL